MKKRGLFVLIALLLAGGTARARTLAQLENDCRLAIKDIPATGATTRWSNSQLQDLINEGQRMVSEAAMPCQNFTTITLAAGTTWYTLPSDYRYAKKVRYFQTGKQPLELYEGSLVDLIVNNPSYDSLAGTPYEYVVNYAPTSSVSNGASVDAPWSVAIISPPNATSLGTVVFQYYAECSDMVNTGDRPYNGLQGYHQAEDLVVYFAAAKIDSIEGDSEGEKDMMALFTAGLAAFKNEIGQIPNYKPGMNGSNGLNGH